MHPTFCRNLKILHFLGIKSEIYQCVVEEIYSLLVFQFENIIHGQPGQVFEFMKEFPPKLQASL